MKALKINPSRRPCLTTLITSLCFTILIGIPGPLKADESPSPKINKVFQKGETSYYSGKFSEAKRYFSAFVRKYPEGSMAEAALLRLGEIEYKTRSYLTAIRYFDYILKKFPDTTHYHTVKFKYGECLFKMARYEEAGKLFVENVKTHPDMSQRWKAFLYLGLIDEKGEKLDKAIGKLANVYHKSRDNLLREHAVQALKKIFDRQMPKLKLVSLSQKYRKEFPGDLILIKLISTLRSQRDNSGYQVALEDFIRRFPNHNLKNKYKKVLAAYTKNKSKNMKLGLVLPLSGRRAQVGQQVLQGVQLALAQMNFTEKKSLELVIKDSGGGKSIANIIEELSIDPNMIGIIGPVLSSNVRASANSLNQYHVPIITPTATSPGITGLSPYIFRNSLTKEAQGKFLASYAINELGLYRFAILYSNESYGNELQENFSREVLRLGGEIVAALPFERSQNDFREQIFQLGGLSDDKLKNLVRRNLRRGKESKPLDDKGNFSRPVVERGLYNEKRVEGLKVSLELNYDAIFIPGYYDKVQLIAPQLMFYNINQATLLGTNGWNSPELAAQAGKYLKSAVFVDGFFAGSDNSAIQNFVHKFKTMFGGTPSIISAQSYDAAMIYISLVRKGARNRIKMMDQLSSVSGFPGISGLTSFLPTGESEKYLTKLKVVGGKIVQVEE